MKFLFLCTGNSCRSILSEVLFNSRAPENWKAYSAGSKPSGQVHPLTIETLENLNLSTEGLWSKTIDDCEQYQPDVVITVCDSAAQEACPLYLGGAIKAHWGLADPSHLDLPKEEKLKALDAALGQIERQFGKGAVMKLGDSSAQMNIETIPTGSLSLDIALGLGGIPRGRVIEIYGPESSGKTTLAIHAIAEAMAENCC